MGGGGVVFFPLGSSTMMEWLVDSTVHTAHSNSEGSNCHSEPGLIWMGLMHERNLLSPESN